MHGLGEALQVPGQIERARIILPRRLAVDLARDLSANLPRGDSPPHVADQVEGRVLPGGVVTVGTFGSEYAAALEEGALRVAKGQALRFVMNGRVTFRHRTLLRRNRPGGRPFTRALRRRRQVVERVWREVMD